MEQDLYIEWLHRQGYHVIKTKSIYWYEISPKVYQAFPYHQIITPSFEEIDNLFKQSKAVAIRYSVPLDQPEGQLSYHVVFDINTAYEVSALPKKVRHDITKGMQYASYEKIPMVRLAEEGWSLREETLIRQRRRKAETRAYWKALCLSADGLPCYEAWGALHEGQLVAALLACTIGDTVGILYQQSLSQHLKFGINNALTYLFTRDVLQRSGIRCIFYGLQSLDAPISVDEYKFRMGYSARPVRQRVVFHPYIAPLIRPMTHKFLKILAKVFPSNYRIVKTEGMVRFYLQGKRVLSKQDWPNVLQDQKEKIYTNAK